MCACVITIAFTVSLCRATISRMLSISSPGSTTMASRVLSSPTIEQLHCSIPTGRISWIITRVYSRYMGDILTALMRWVHLSSVVTLIGGVFYSRLVMTPAAGGLPADARATLDERAAAAFRPVMFTAITGLVLSGIYNYLMKPGHSALYHSLFGVKVLL